MVMTFSFLVCSDVPQKSVVSITLFLLFINSLLSIYFYVNSLIFHSTHFKYALAFSCLSILILIFIICMEFLSKIISLCEFQLSKNSIFTNQAIVSHLDSTNILGLTEIAIRNPVQVAKIFPPPAIQRSHLFLFGVLFSQLSRDGDNGVLISTHLLDKVESMF